MTSQPRSMYRVNPGLQVFTVDGEHLGEVKAVERDAFKVDAAWRPDYWLGMDTVLSVIPEERVTVDISSESLAAYKNRSADEATAGWERPGGRSGRRPDGSRPLRPRYDAGLRPRRRGYDWNAPQARRESGREGRVPETEWGRPDFDYEEFPGEPGYDPRSFEAPRRRFERRGRYAGLGPAGYGRSDERLREEVCDALTRNGMVDASDIEVSVENGEVTLAGIVDTRNQKRTAEDVAGSVQGVFDVHNRLRAVTTMASQRGAEEPGD